MKKLPKIFVLDTNIILHDFRAIANFQDNDVVIPITVIEELDKFKKGNDVLNYNAREFMRELDKISSNRLFSEGIRLGKDKGTITVSLGHKYTEQMKESFIDDTPDHRIIATAQWYKDHHPERRVILVSKDINLRMKAKALNIMAQDYLTDKLNEEKIERTKREVVEMVRLNPVIIDKIKESDHGVPISEFKLKKRPACNQLYKISSGPKNEKQTTLAKYDPFSKSVIEVKSKTVYGITPRNHEQVFALEAVMNPNIKLISLTGGAGTGKTLIALAGALAQEAHFDQILLSRPVIPLKNQELGFLPGDVKDKIGPYMLPLFDNLTVIKNNFKQTSKEVVRIEDMLRSEKLLINPLAYIRGRSLQNVFFIVDEAQNLTPHEVKTIITRAGEGTKIVFTGDIFQIDQPYLDIHSNGLSHLGDKMFGQAIFEHVNLFKGERSQLSELAGKLL